MIYEATCKVCQKTIHPVETTVSKNYKRFRTKKKLANKNMKAKNRPSHWPVLLEDGQQIQEAFVKNEDIPSDLLILNMPLPGLLTNAPLIEKTPDSLRVTVGGCPPKELANFTSNLGATHLKTEYSSHPFMFYRMIAKIAHTHAVSLVGLEGVDFCLPPIILGQSQHVSHYIGGTQKWETLIPQEQLSLGIGKIKGVPYLFSHVTLSPDGEFPTYQAVVGRILDLKKVMEMPLQRQKEAEEYATKKRSTGRTPPIPKGL